MRRTLIFAAAAGFAALPILTGPALAQANRTFVSGHGADSNPCSVAAPCRTFAQAITQTNAGGEIVVLDSAGYGVLTIDKSITITNPGGVEAGITATSGENAIIIAASSAITVTLRGLTLEGGGVGNAGIVLISTGGGTLNILDGVVKDFAGNGIDLLPNGGAQLNVVIANTVALDNAGDGIKLAPTGTQSNFAIVAMVYQTTANDNNGTGIAIGSGISGVISNSHADANNTAGITEATGSFIIMKNSTAVRNEGNDVTVASTGSLTGTLQLVNNNTIIFLSNAGATFTDGTNNISGIEGNISLIKLGTQ